MDPEVRKSLLSEVYNGLHAVGAEAALCVEELSLSKYTFSKFKIFKKSHFICI